ncbi:MAG: M48 family metallopeptidase [Candidatus Phytoplasma sp.]|nr:M48 family metallopeptidase [Phytoplasma sp.]
MRVIKTFEYNQRDITCIIEYKKIKNAYLRIKEDTVYVSANKKFTETQIMHFVKEKYPLLLKKQNNRSVVSKYAIWGKELTEATYFKESIRDEKNYERILTEAIKEKTEVIIENIKPNLEKIGLKTVPIKYKKLKSKYGSCHIIKKEITLNIFLAKIDPVYLEYVIYHEYAHLLVPNHSKQFYEVLDKLMPNHKQIQKSLKKIPIIF